MKLLNRSEELTFDRLQAAVAGDCARVFPKVRIADTLPVNGSGINDGLFRFALMAHFDFVVSNPHYEPLFAVEFDGPLHASSDEQRERDAKKNDLCEHFQFPLLRINSRYIDVKYRGMDLLSYFIHLWFLSAAFDDAQEKGLIPYDEPFDPNWIISDGKTNRRFPYWLSLDVQLEIKTMHNQGRLHDYVPSHWTGIDQSGNYRSLAWLQAGQNEFLITHTGMRRQLFPADVSDVLGQVSVFDLRRMVDGFFEKQVRTKSRGEFQAELAQYKDRYKMCSFCGSSQFS
jgi:hypothetical protein